MEADIEEDPFLLEAHGRSTSSTVVVSASKYAGNGDEQSKKAILAMLQVATDDWSKLLFFANDAMHALIHTLISGGRTSELPNPQDAKDWEAVIQFVYSLRDTYEKRVAKEKASNQAQETKKKKNDANDKKRPREEKEYSEETTKRIKKEKKAKVTAASRRASLLPVWKNIIERIFKDHDLSLKSAMHTNQFEAMAGHEATTCSNFNKKKILKAHMKRYLVAKYQIGGGGAGELATRILQEDPLDFTKIYNKAMAKTHTVEDAKVIVQCEADLYRSFVGFGDPDPRSLVAYRFFMLKEIDKVVREVRAYNTGKGEKEKRREPKRFSLIPMHACGGVLTADITGNWMTGLLSAVKDKHKGFFGYVNQNNKDTKQVVKTANAIETESKLPNDLRNKLWFYFPGLHKLKNRSKSTTKWRLGGTVRTNGVELQVIFDSNRRYMKDGRPLSEKYIPRIDQVGDKTWNLPKWPKRMPQDTTGWTDLAGVDPGHHNLYCATRYTGELTDEGDPEVEVRKISKKYFTRSSGRTAKLHKSKRLNRTAQKKGLMDEITENSLKTADTNAFLRSLYARRDTWRALYTINSNKKAKRMKLAMRARENRTIDRIIDYITWKGKVVPAIGDCSRTTGIKGTSPGGPLKKIGRRLIKRGYSAFQVNEAYSTKSSVCCRGAVNFDQPNGQPNATSDCVHGILICPKCRRTWNRDLVGAVNITDIAIDHLMGLPRDPRFTKALTEYTGEVKAHSGFIPRPSTDASTRGVARLRTCSTSAS